MSSMGDKIQNMSNTYLSKQFIDFTCRYRIDSIMLIEWRPACAALGHHQSIHSSTHFATGAVGRVLSLPRAGVKITTLKSFTRPFELPSSIFYRKVSPTLCSITVFATLEGSSTFLAI